MRDHVLAARAPEAFLARWREISAPTLGATRLLDAEAMRTYYLPGRSGRLVFEAHVARREQHRRRRYLFLQTYPTAGRARRRVEAALSKKRPLKSSGPPAFGIPEWNAVAWELPNGPQLRGLRTFMKRKALRRFLQRSGLLHLAEPKLYRPRLLRYIPRKRALFLWKHEATGRLERLYIKAFAPGEDETAAANLAALAAPDAGLGSVRVPRLFHHAPERRAVLMTEVAGEVFTSAYAAGRPESFQAVGDALGTLHASGVVPTARWTLEGELAALERAMEDVTRTLPSVTERVDGLVATLRSEASRLEPVDERPIHANLFGDQIHLGDDGVGLVDWDDLAWGDPVYDLGRLLAHVVFCVPEGARAPAPALGALVETWERRLGRPAPWRRLRLHVACALLLRMKIDALRKLPDGWVEQIAGSIDRAEAILGSSSRTIRALELA